MPSRHRPWIILALATACSPSVPATADTSSGETGPSCPIGSDLCPCTAAGSCDPGLVCSAGTCVAVDCEVGSVGCPCTPGGGCDPGLACDAGVCGDATTSIDTASGSTAPTTTSTGDPTEGPTTSPDSSSTDPSAGTSSETGTPADLEPWTRRRPVLLTNDNDVVLTDHQVKLDLDWDDDFAPALADLRFTDEAGIELLAHWVEDSLAPVSARVWVRVPMLPASDESTIYMWYGNPAAQPDERPADVFDLWEAFDGDDLPPGWTATDEFTVANGRLTLERGCVYTDAPLVTLPGVVVEILARNPNLMGQQASVLSVAELQAPVANQDFMQFFMSPGFISAYDSLGAMLVGYQWNPPAGPPASEFAWHAVGMGGEVIRFARTHEETDGYMLDFAGDLPNDYYISIGHSSGSMSGSNEIEDVDVETLLVRKFALEPPISSIGAEEDV